VARIWTDSSDSVIGILSLCFLSQKGFQNIRKQKLFCFFVSWAFTAKWKQGNTWTVGIYADISWSQWKFMFFLPSTLQVLDHLLYASKHWEPTVSSVKKSDMVPVVWWEGPTDGEISYQLYNFIFGLSNSDCFSNCDSSQMRILSVTCHPYALWTKKLARLPTYISFRHQSPYLIRLQILESLAESLASS
jgi:hypothetical protein